MSTYANITKRVRQIIIALNRCTRFRNEYNEADESNDYCPKGQVFAKQ